MTLYQNKYRIESNRLAGYDYTTEGAYFITLCVRYHKHDFGYIQDGALQASPKGLIAHQCWLELFGHFDTALMGEFVIMPNHMHGVIIIDDPEQKAKKYRESLDAIKEEQQYFIRPPKGGVTGYANPMLSHHTLGKMVRWYKAKCAFKIRKELGLPFEWLNNYYDHVVRNEKDMKRIQQYIINNPATWERDKFYL